MCGCSGRSQPIRAVIRASAINTNGKGLGITHPGPAGQEEVIRQAYGKASLDFEETGYVECHGTGTPVGDPIEVGAIGSCFAPSRSSDTPLLLSAVKSQIGHTEGASGIAGVQKVVLSMEHCMIPATIGIKRINPAYLRDGRLRIVQQLERWPSHFKYGRASVNSFGYGGANAHVIIDNTQSFFQFCVRQNLSRTWTFLNIASEEEKLEVPSEATTQKQESHSLLVSSAHSPSTLQMNIARITEITCVHDIKDLAYTLGLKRSHFHQRSFCIAASSPTDVKLSEWKQDPGSAKPPSIAFVFTGQGAQWPRMGIELMERYHVVRETFNQLQKCLDDLPDRPDWTLQQVLSTDPIDSLMMKDVVVSVTLCTAIQIVIVDLMSSWDVRPTAIVGHSSGEAAAAYCAGYLTLSETITTSYYRALSLERNPEAGLMMAVGLGAKQVDPSVSEQDHLYLLNLVSTPELCISLMLSNSQKEKER